MMFAEEPRFKSVASVRAGGGGALYGYSRSETSEFVGPGTYESSPVGRRSHSKRKPKMDPPALDQRHSYVNGTLHQGSFLASPPSKYQQDNTGVGYYSPTREKVKGWSGLESRSPRSVSANAHGASKTVVHGSLVVQSTEKNNENLGPGSYNLKSTLIKPSHNARLNTHKTHRRTTSGASIGSAGSGKSIESMKSPRR